MPVQLESPHRRGNKRKLSQEFYLSCFNNRGFSSAGVRISRSHYPEEDWKPTAPAVEESGFLRRSFHTHNRPNVSGILDKLATLIDAVVYINQILYCINDTHKRIHPVLIL
jgi:hypothetical protein